MKCTKCEHITELEVAINFKFFICPKCFSFHEFLIDKLYFKKALIKSTLDCNLPIGKAIVFENETFCVSNFIEKKINSEEYWSEYELVSSTGKKKYFIEENGHWIVSEEVDVKRDNNSLEIHHDTIDYRIFEKGSFFDQSGVGFFNYEFSNEVIGFRDYINPPYILSVEVEDKKNIYYKGSHIQDKEIKKIFGLENLPDKEAVGVVQPFFLNLNNVITVFCAASIIILLLHLFFYQNAKNQLVYKSTIDLTTQIDKQIETDVFELKGPIAPLNIIIQTDVNDSWLATDFSLINQTTSEASYFSKDIELYSGYEGGESWTEGSQTEDFIICGVSSGKYQISFKPTKDVNDNQNNVMYVKVYWNKSNNWNFMLAIVSFLVITVLIYYIKTNFESRRWYDSDYSPYKKDE